MVPAFLALLVSCLLICYIVCFIGTSCEASFWPNWLVIQFLLKFDRDTSGRRLTGNSFIFQKIFPFLDFLFFIGKIFELYSFGIFHAYKDLWRKLFGSWQWSTNHLKKISDLFSRCEDIMDWEPYKDGINFNL